MSIQCPICYNFVDSFNQQGHVIPRFILVKLKENGRSVRASKSDGVKEKAQRDRKDYLWCDECEKVFQGEDSFASNFFYQKQGFIKEIEKDNLSGRQILQYDRNSLEKVFSFIVSISIREEIMLLKENKDGVLGKRFDAVLELWKRGINFTTGDLLIVKILI